ncbi:hypothetical protein GCM10009827_114450 [Dactylosporangium maewongense]|uniref:Lipoprotein n=1 Tax=Dactylosporangium maewongense TaxID=634393 RepID=A0ABP4P614_9ACTN
MGPDLPGREMKRLALAAALVLALAGCSEQLGDRGGKEGAPPDKISDVDYIEVFRNADNFPNVAMVCVRGIAFAATASREGMSAPSLLRVPEWDARCKTVSPGTAPSTTPSSASPSPFPS